MTTLRLILVCLVSFTWVANPASACDEVLGVCLETSVNPPGALVTRVTGELARRLRREDDPQQYFLAAGQHVITSVNGERVSSREECVETLRKSGAVITIDVFNKSKETTRTYTANASQDRPQVEPKGEDGAYQPGSAHPSLKHVIAGKKPGVWIPEPGYAWINSKDTSVGVRWLYNQRHPQLGGIYSSKKEGVWNLQPGFVWANDEPHDLRTRYVGLSESDSGYSTGTSSSDPGFSGQDAWRIGNQYKHSPWNYKGYTGPSGR